MKLVIAEKPSVGTLISSAIAGLNAEDIESFNILKDGSATSIYGARCQTTLPLVAGYKIVRIIITMYVTRFHNLQLHHLFLRRNRQYETEKQAINKSYSFHSFSIFSGCENTNRAPPV